MTVMCEMHNMLKELKAAADRGMNSELYSSVTRPETAPLPANMFTESLNELDDLEGSLRKSPKKAGNRTLRGASATAFLFSSSSSKTGMVPNSEKSTHASEKIQQSGGLAGPVAVDPKEASSLEESPPPPPPTESGSLSDSSVPPPPPSSGSRSNSADLTSLAPSNANFAPAQPSQAQVSRIPSGNTSSASLEPADAATYVSAPMEKEKRPRPKAAALPSGSGSSTGAVAPSTTTPAKPANSSIAPPPQTAPVTSPAAKKTAQALTKLVTHELPSSFVRIHKDTIEETPPLETSALSQLLGPTDVQVWLPGAKKTMTIRILPSATMQQLIQQTIKKHNAQVANAPGERPLDSNADAYNVRVALEDGQPDTLFPVLARKGTLDQWAEVAFVLIENPNYKPAPTASGEEAAHQNSSTDRSRAASISASGSHAYTTSSTSNYNSGDGSANANQTSAQHHHHHHVSHTSSTNTHSSRGNNYSDSSNQGSGNASGNSENHQHYSSAAASSSTAVTSSNSTHSHSTSNSSANPSSGSGGAPTGSATSSAHGASGSQPHNADKVVVRVTLPTGAYHSLLAETSMKLGALLTLLCEKRQLNPANFALVSLEKSYLSQHMRVQDLKELHLVLEAKSNADSLPQTAEEIFYHGNVAVQYKLFSSLVFHIKNKKKFGNNKTEAVSLGIDGTKLEIIFAKKGSSPYAYAISDLKVPTHTDDNPFFVSIETIKEKDKLVFEANSAASALEIITKLTILLDRIGKDSSTPH